MNSASVCVALGPGRPEFEHLYKVKWTLAHRRTARNIFYIQFIGLPSRLLLIVLVLVISPRDRNGCRCNLSYSYLFCRFPVECFFEHIFHVNVICSCHAWGENRAFKQRLLSSPDFNKVTKWQPFGRFKNVSSHVPFDDASTELLIQRCTCVMY